MPNASEASAQHARSLPLGISILETPRFPCLGVLIPTPWVHAFEKRYMLQFLLLLGQHSFTTSHLADNCSYSQLSTFRASHHVCLQSERSTPLTVDIFF
uniref:Uncharacterized protein n=1 Tax=Physcomitrium patens TaxID=3218 RepID=A0A2K1IFH5_PHYPA|nr:hypothetical protein PHYPA_028618 [Physcomitrium patens]